MAGRWQCQNLTKFVHLQSQTNPQYQWTVWWKCIDIYLLSPRKKIQMDIWQTDGGTYGQVSETIIPHSHVVGYKNGPKQYSLHFIVFFYCKLMQVATHRRALFVDVVRSKWWEERLKPILILNTLQFRLSRLRQVDEITPSCLGRGRSRCRRLAGVRILRQRFSS